MELQGVLGFLGFGNMGSAIARGLINTNTIEANRIAAYDADMSKRPAIEALGAMWAESPAALAGMSRAIMLAVKPQTMAEALDQLKPGFSPGTLVISIAAGISIGWLQERLGAAARVIRVMPNTPAMVGAGAAGIAPSANCSEADAAVARAIFEAVGIADFVREQDIDAVTAVSGSGPAYFFYLVECLVRAGVAQGLDAATATRLAAQTALGAGRLLAESGEPPAVLRERVTSKGGTTAAALAQFYEKDLDAIIKAGVDAAAARSRELGK